MLNDVDFLRYSRQLLLDEFGTDAQEKLQQARVLIVGVGGLGSPAALYLAAAGVGKLLLADDDKLHISNLQRQILFRSNETGQPKAQLAQQHLLALNPQINAIALTLRMDQASLQPVVAQVDLVLDCSDNMAARHAINACCVASNTALISGSAVGFSGQLMVISPPWQQGCYRCLWPDEAEPQRNCRTVGVLGPVTGAIGTLQALEALKMLTGQTSALEGKLRLFDAREQSWRTLNLQRANDCQVCGCL